MKILLIKAHPHADSYCHALADEYHRGALEAGHDLKVIELAKLGLEKHLKEGHKEKVSLDEELAAAQADIAWADLLVFAYPTWWASPPAMLKLFLEIMLTPGFAYKYHKRKWIIPRWDKLLKGKSVRLIVTMDGPPLYHRLYIRDPGYKLMNASFRFCGAKPVRRSYFGSVKLSGKKTRQRWLQKAYKLGCKE